MRKCLEPLAKKAKDIFLKKKFVVNFAGPLLKYYKDQGEILAISPLENKSKDKKELSKELRRRGKIFYNFLMK